MEKRIIECVPNFSEGRKPEVIKQITDRIESVDGVRLLDVDMGAATNRTVVTFVGEPDAVTEAAFRAVQIAAELIDMRYHKGNHPRMGATDVIPLIPVSGISLKEAALLAQALAKRIATELNVPTYCYEAAALSPERKGLENCRSGEYEGLSAKINTKEGKPDFGSTQFTEHVARTGASVVGAREFLIAVNFNLNTTSVRKANAIAFDIREKGRVKREGNPVTGKIVKDANGETEMIPGTLKATKAIGWYIDEYQIAQVSVNLTNISVTPLHIAFEEAAKKAEERGTRVTGTEIVGLVPKRALIEAGEYFLRKQNRSLGIPEHEVIRIAILSMGLDQLKPFIPEEKIIEYQIADKQGNTNKLVDLTCRSFADTTLSESPAPGGGSVSAYMSALGAALGGMVANLSANKPGWDDRWEYFSDYAVKAQTVMNRLLSLVDEDTQAFNRIMDTYKMPRGTVEEKSLFASAMEEATLHATEIPLQTMYLSLQCFEVLLEMAKNGNKNSISDAGVGAYAVYAAIHGAALNVKINAATLTDGEAAAGYHEVTKTLIDQAENLFNEVVEIVNAEIK